MSIVKELATWMDEMYHYPINFTIRLEHLHLGPGYEQPAQTRNDTISKTLNKEQRLFGIADLYHAWKHRQYMLMLQSAVKGTLWHLG